MGNIKTSDEDFYLIGPENVDKFKRGTRYEVSYTTSEFGGKEFKTIKDWKQIGDIAPKLNGGGTFSTPLEMFVREAFCSSLQYGEMPERGAAAKRVSDLRWAWQEGMKERTGDAIDDEIPF